MRILFKYVLDTEPIVKSKSRHDIEKGDVKIVENGAVGLLNISPKEKSLRVKDVKLRNKAMRNKFFSSTN